VCTPKPFRRLGRECSLPAIIIRMAGMFEHEADMPPFGLAIRLLPPIQMRVGMPDASPGPVRSGPRSTWLAL
jgi:hypothetical protein